MNRVLDPFASPRSAGLISNLLIVWTVLFVSLVVLSKMGSGMGTELESAPRGAPWTPPGAVIGGVWTTVYTLMALSLWRINSVGLPESFAPKLWVISLIAFCIIWPFYAFDTPSRWPGLLGNVGIFALSLVAAWRVSMHSVTAASLLLPTTVWITVATISILDGARRYGW